VNPILHSERLALTPVCPADVDIALEMFTDPEVMKYIADPMAEADIHDEMDNWMRRGGDGRFGIWCISDRRTGEKLGSAALLPLPVDEDDTNYDLLVPGEKPEGDIEVGYFLRRRAWGHGYATEVCRQLLELAFSEPPLDEVVATIDPENARSRNVLEKAGFRDHGTTRCYGEDGAPIYRITFKEWAEMAR